MNDPLADPRAHDLLSAQPGDVGALASLFRSAAGEARRTAGGLWAVQHDARWAGKAANSFRRSIGRLPAELDAVRIGWGGVGAALDTYEPELARLKSAFQATVSELSDARARLGGARTAVGLAWSADRPPGGAELGAGDADGALIALERTIQGLSTRAFDLLDEFANVRDACRRGIAAAEGA